MPNLRGTEDFRGYIVLHGWLMYFSFGLLFPAGALFARFMQVSRRTKNPNIISKFYKLHLYSEALGTFLMFIGVISGFAQLGISTTHTHQRLGYALWIIIWIHVLSAFLLRPGLGSLQRGIWYVAHWLMGTSSILLGIYNTYSGIGIWEKVFPKQRLLSLNIAFSVQLAFMGLVYYALDRYDTFLLQIKKRETSVAPKVDEMDHKMFEMDHKMFQMDPMDQKFFQMDPKSFQMGAA
ncbi:hypothetical protein KP509_20G051000 [Ceratopteris richardii]|uniref:Cytochrome b561 domain-containing protein n=1 Tax=Ceratopteris richardii TaxID=49495 RepID=A0A8T2SIT2_CERRI|nr:hypothetical protein KP509_20G051000 [Ceratopteris richardii]